MASLTDLRLRQAVAISARYCAPRKIPVNQDLDTNWLIRCRNLTPSHDDVLINVIDVPDDIHNFAFCRSRSLTARDDPMALFGVFSSKIQRLAVVSPHHLEREQT